MTVSRHAVSIALFVVLLIASGHRSEAQSWEALSQQATQANRSGDHKRAVEIWARLMTMKPSHPEELCAIAWSAAGVRGWNLGEMQQAEDDGTKAVQCVDALQPSNNISAQDITEFRFEARRVRRFNRRDAGDYEGAIADSREMTVLLPAYKSSDLLAEAEIEELKGNHDRALALLAQAIETAQGADAKSTALIRRAFALAKNGRSAEAQADLAKALEAKPFVVGRDADKQAELFAALGRYDLASNAYKRDEDAGTAQTAGYGYLRSSVEAARGDFTAAAAAIRKAEAQQANNAAVLVAGYLARARAGQKDTSSLSAATNRFNENKWPDAAIFFVLGKIGADQLVVRAAFGNPRIQRSRMALANLYIGEIALVNGDKDKARKAFAEAATYCTEDALAQACLWAKGELNRM